MSVKIYQGSVEITSGNAKEWAKKLEGVTKITGALIVDSNASLPALQSVGADLIVYSNASLQADALQSVGADLRVYSKLSPQTEELLWGKYRNKRDWYLSDTSSDSLLSRKSKRITYRLSDVIFDRQLFNQVRLGKLSAAQVFAIPNMEQRRIAYERMDKAKMQKLPLKVVDSVADDGHGYPMRIVEFSVDGYSAPFRFLNCHCPSGGREYFLETQQDTCWAAKAASFGLPDDVEWVAEY